MLNVYIKLYGICFVATVILIVALLAAGTKMDKKESCYQDAEDEQSQSDKGRIGYILRTLLIAFVVSFAAPLVLVFYAFVIGCVIITALTDK